MSSPSLLLKCCEITHRTLAQYISICLTHQNTLHNLLWSFTYAYGPVICYVYKSTFNMADLCTAGMSSVRLPATLPYYVYNATITIADQRIMFTPYSQSHGIHVGFFMFSWSTADEAELRWEVEFHGFQSSESQAEYSPFYFHISPLKCRRWMILNMKK